ncbi:hypothetical protein JXI42_00915, partial [bacterium]|nr:hypothetical protein [bacterium]
MAVFEICRNKKFLLEAIDKAEDFIDIVSFQFTSEQIIRLLVNKLEEGVKVRVITLPEDSYREVTKRKDVKKLYDLIVDKGGEIYQCLWEVGVPELTETSLSGDQTEGGGSKWYSMHGKFIVTDKEALAISANFTDENQLEVYLAYNDNEIINQFQAKFEFLKTLFCTRGDLIQGLFLNSLPLQIKQEVLKFYKEVGRIIIKDYPPIVSPETKLKKGMFISPFEGRGRFFWEQVINTAERFIYLSTERLYDDKVVEVLLNKAYMSDIPIRVMSGNSRSVRQNPEKAEKMVSDLMAAGLEFAVIDDIHAKFWITDKWLCVASANLGKMNLGFRKIGNYWRANTETLWFDNDIKTINEAKSNFEAIFSDAKTGIIAISDVGTKLNKAKDLFKIFGFSSRKKAKVLMARIQTQFTVENRQNITRIAKLAARLAQIEKSKYITEEHVLMANVLFYLRLRKHTMNEIIEKMKMVSDKNPIIKAIEELLKKRYITEELDYYIINIEEL